MGNRAGDENNTNYDEFRGRSESYEPPPEDREEMENESEKNFAPLSSRRSGKKVQFIDRPISFLYSFIYIIASNIDTSKCI